MRQHIISLALLFICTAANAQNSLSLTCNTLRPDSLNFEKTPLFDVGCEGVNVIWDYSDLDIKDQSDTSAVRLYRNEGRFVWDDNCSLTTYSQKGDTLLISREETPSYEMDFDVPVVRMVYPFLYGSVITTPFSGKGSYEDKFNITENGVSQVKGDAYGTLILTEGDTVRNVLRVHTIFDSNMAVSERISGDFIGSMRKVTDTFEWYAHGYRYPVLKITGNYLMSGEEIVSYEVDAHRMSPEMQKAVEDEENEELRGRNITNSIINYNVQVNGYTATIKYDLLEDTHISIALADSMGIVYWRYEDDKSAGEGYQTVVPLSDRQRGQYVIYINVNNEVNNCKINVE